MQRFALLVMLAGCWSGAPLPTATPIANRAPPTPARLPSPLAAELGVYAPSGAFVPTTEIPLFVGSEFGWRVQLRCSPGEAVAIREELRLPAPGDWGTSPTLEVNSDGSIAKVRDHMVCEDEGWIEKSWSVSPGDPPGEWVIKVTPDGYAPVTLRATFTPTSP